MSKYDRLRDSLSSREALSKKNLLLRLTFEQINEILSPDSLPSSAYRYRPWWGNEVHAASRQCRSWLDAGWRVERVDLDRKFVEFRRMTSER